MSTRPGAFFSFAAQHSELLTALFRHEGGIGDGELEVLIERHRGDAEASVAYQFEQLRKLRLIEPAPAGDATWQLSFPVQQLLGFLLRQQMLTGAAIINAYVAEMDGLATDLEQAAADSDAERVVRALADLTAPLERLRNDSANNRDRLTTEALELKAEAGKTSPKARFARINHLWNRYLIPLREVLDTDGRMDATLDRLGRALGDARAAFATRASVDQGLLRARRTLVRLHRSVYSDHEESVGELEPLYHQLRRESRLSRGASRALELLRAERWAGLPVDRWLALPKRERGSRFSDSALEAFLHGMRGYSPRRPEAIADGAAGPPPPRIDREALRRRLREDAPIPDILAWLTRHFGDQGASQVLRAYGWFHTGALGAVTEPPGQHMKEYALRDVVLRTRPLALEDPS